MLTYSQSQVLCEAYGGVVNVDWSVPTDLRALFDCGDRSRLHLFKEADHAFEVCPFASITSACHAGSPAGAALLIDSLQKGRQWLNPVAPAAPASMSVPLANVNGKYTVSWGTATGTVTHYELYESTDRTFAAPGVLAYSGTSPSALFKYKTSGTYYYRVRACNNDLCSGYLQGDNAIVVLRLNI